MNFTHHDVEPEGLREAKWEAARNALSIPLKQPNQGHQISLWKISKHNRKIPRTARKTILRRQGQEANEAVSSQRWCFFGFFRWILDHSGLVWPKLNFRIPKSHLATPFRRRGWNQGARCWKPKSSAVFGRNHWSLAFILATEQSEHFLLSEALEHIAIQILGRDRKTFFVWNRHSFLAFGTWVVHESNSGADLFLHETLDILFSSEHWAGESWLTLPQRPQVPPSTVPDLSPVHNTGFFNFWGIVFFVIRPKLNLSRNQDVFVATLSGSRSCLGPFRPLQALTCSSALT